MLHFIKLVLALFVAMLATDSLLRFNPATRRVEGGMLGKGTKVDRWIGLLRQRLKVGHKSRR